MVGPHDHHHQLQQQQQHHHQQATKCSCGDPTCNQFVLVNVSADSLRPLVHHHGHHSGMVQTAAMTAQPIYYAAPTAPYGQAPPAPVTYRTVVDDSAVGFYHQHVQPLVPAANIHHGQVMMAVGSQYLSASGHSGPMWQAPAAIQGYVEPPRPHNGSQPVWNSMSAGSELPHSLITPSSAVDARPILPKPEAGTSTVGACRTESAADLATATRDGGSWRVPQFESSEKGVAENTRHSTVAFDDDDSKPTKEISHDVVKTSQDNLAG
jgi:hypothetical protein